MWFVFNCGFVCECFLLINMVVCFVRDALCDVVRFVFLCVLSMCMLFVLSVFVRFARDV